MNHTLHNVEYDYTCFFYLTTNCGHLFQNIYVYICVYIHSHITMYVYAYAVMYAYIYAHTGFF